MMNRLAPVDGARRRPASIVLGWAILLVVILSAAPNGGEPRTRLVGSAFDPASVSVALNRKPQPAALCAQADDDTARDRAEPPALPARAAIEQWHAVRAMRPAPSPSRMIAIAAAPFPTGGAHGPRAPPTA